MLLDLIRYLRGYVVFEVKGRFPERFLNIAARRSVRLWRVSRSADSLSAAMYMRDYLNARHLALACGVRLCLKEKHGLPVLLKKYEGRVGVLLGAGAFAAAIFVMSLFIWSVDITGLEHISESEMRALLREHGMVIGAFKPTMDFTTVSRSVMLSDSRIGWMAINVSGSYASVEIKEEAAAPKVKDIYAPCNVKARRDGVLLRIETAEGDCLMKEGSGVVKGQLVVSGVMEDAFGGSRLVHADARLIARTDYEVAFTLPQEQKSLCPTGEVTERLSLNVMGLRLPLTLGGVHSSLYYSDEREEALNALEVRLPLGLDRERVYALKTAVNQHDDNSTKEILIKKAQLYEVFALCSCTVTAREYHTVFEDGSATLTASYTCEEDIAYQEEIGVIKE